MERCQLLRLNLFESSRTILVLVGSKFLISFSRWHCLLDIDFTIRSQTTIVSVDIEQYRNPASPEVLDAFEVVMEKLRGDGRHVKGLILSNPGNPIGMYSHPVFVRLIVETGYVLSKESILAYCRFAERHDIHLISDEIYALSIFKNQGIVVLKALPKKALYLKAGENRFSKPSTIYFNTIAWCCKGSRLWS